MGSHYEIAEATDGSRSVIAPDGREIASGISPPVSSVDDAVLDAIMDDVGLTDSATRSAMKAVVRGVRIKE